jgi:IS30 family transposase
MKTTINNSYCHISATERELIGLLLNQGNSKRQIALSLNRHISSIYRELNKNYTPGNNTAINLATHNNLVYIPSQAHKKYQQRICYAHRRKRLNDKELREYIKYHLEHTYWSPAMIAARWNKEHPERKTNYESIYQWIYNDAMNYTRFLPNKRPVRKNRASLKRKNVVPDKTFIDKRPAVVNSRSTFGHYEADTVVSSDNKSAIAVLVERKSRCYFVKSLTNKTAEQMHNALVEILKPLPQEARKTITYDQGPENVLHKLTNQVLSMESYFCYPYHSWEKGGVENRNKIIRRFFPKGTNWRLITQEDIDRVVHIINNMPLKCLNWLTPYEVFYAEIHKFALTH